MINVVGIGVGNPQYLTKIAVETIRNSEIIIGGERQIKDCKNIILSDNIFKIKKITEIISILNDNKDKNTTILVSGDTGFYSLLNFIKKNYKNEKLNVITGISSFQYLFEKLKEIWQEYRLISLHGREENFISILKECKKLIILTDNINTPFTIAKKIYNENLLEYEMVIGENLSYENEKILFCDIKDYEKLNRKFDINIVVVREKEN